MENQQGTFSSYFAVLLPAILPCKLVKNYPACTMKKPSNYGTVRIGLLNFTADENIKFLRLFSIVKVQNFSVVINIIHRIFNLALYSKLL